MKTLNRSSILLGCVAITSAQPAFSAKQTDKPNIVIIMADDLGWGDVGFNGSECMTPNIDAFAEVGVKMNRFYTAPVSSPTRAGLITGRYPNRFGIRTAVIPPWREDGLDAEEDTIAEMLGRNGYENRAIIGKWHLGHTYKEHYPMSRGFTHFYGHLNGAIDYFDHTREGELDWHNDWESCYDEGYSTELITKEAVRCIGEYKEDGAFMLYVAYNAPHTPIQAQQSDIELYTKEFDKLSKQEQKKVTFRAMVSCLDRGVGEILDELERQDLMDNTLVIFFSDNGAATGQAKGSSSGDLRASKFHEWDGGVRSPAIIYWKDGIGKYEAMADQVTGFVDIMPTVKELVGDKSRPEREFDGVSMMPIINGKKNSIDRYFYLGCGAVVQDDYKLIRKGFNGRMKIDEDVLIDYRESPYEQDLKPLAEMDQKIYKDLLKMAIKYDTITPFLPEVPYDAGKEGFVVPKEWRVTK